MFWNKKKRSQAGKYPYRACNIYISEKHQQILFVPFGRADIGLHIEQENVIVDTWPCKFQDLQTNIEEALNRYQLLVPYDKDNLVWHSFDLSKAKTRHSFEADYISLHLSTDTTKEYGSHEKERIRVSAEPNPPDSTYSLTGCSHLTDTRIAQITLDIYDACVKIRS
ncbi:hypothetical protein [Chitinophaga niabensis]|uniref:Uncharacterized protein n=1 Tax=Chitinophaga niabensis TaxID=536979 RepID=A0A1N6K845_9BACT|nr:hypothetical protein [Chitinophaga niabensis]SIO52725.1 hypothetical protein SAMN04488055_5284 [Chitinophaga niabensis]